MLLFVNSKLCDGRKDLPARITLPGLSRGVLRLNFQTILIVGSGMLVETWPQSEAFPAHFTRKGLLIVGPFVTQFVTSKPSDATKGLHAHVALKGFLPLNIQIILHVFPKVILVVSFRASFRMFFRLPFLVFLLVFLLLFLRVLILMLLQVLRQVPAKVLLGTEGPSTFSAPKERGGSALRVTHSRGDEREALADAK